jgi:hypothetical protein
MFGINYGQTKPLVDLISIGIVGEDNREYYAISKDFNLEEAWGRFELSKDEHIEYNQNGSINCHTKATNKVYWIRENVLKPIFVEWRLKANAKIVRLGLPIQLNVMEFNYKNFKYCIKCIGKTNKQIAEEIKDYISDKRKLDTGLIDQYGFTYNALKTFEGRMRCIEVNWGLPQFYAYYGAFDYVAFSQIFGGFESYPKSFPQYFIDLKQELDKEAIKMSNGNNPNLYPYSFDEALKVIKSVESYPQEPTTHHALSDANWNKQLHEFLNTL